jgi:Sulfatase-modifying factor enzyme 1
MSKYRFRQVCIAGALVVSCADAAHAVFPGSALRRCGPDAVVAGTVCLDKYESSVWRVPNPATVNLTLVKRIQLGLATRADLVAAGATRLGVAFDNYTPCRDTGQNCTADIYAVSLPSETPSAHITWFQAQEACANAGKRLPTNAEWQVGANGTPDPGPDNGTTDCNSNTQVVSLTGGRRDCVSARGAFDMVGNLAEWVADWVPASTACPNWGGFSDDEMCLAGASDSIQGPGALLRGGWFSGGEVSGPLTVLGSLKPISAHDFVGFRCAR